MTAYAGIDYSMTCPSVFISDGRTGFLNGKSFFYYMPKSKRDSKDGVWGNICGADMETGQADMRRFDLISEWCWRILVHHGVTKVCMEGYSMGSRGRVFNIAENTAILKYKMYSIGVELITPSPNEVKKYFSGKGNAKKPDMHDALFSREGVNVSDVFGLSSEKSPVSDIVDAYAMYLYGVDQFKGSL